MLESHFSKVAGLQPVISLKRLQHRRDLCEIFKISLLQKTSGRLLLFLFSEVSFSVDLPIAVNSFVYIVVYRSVTSFCVLLEEDGFKLH